MAAFISLLVCGVLIGLVFMGYPVLLVVLSSIFGKSHKDAELLSDEETPTVTMIIVARNAEHLVEEKLANSLALDYPADKLSLVLYSDGSTDGTTDAFLGYASDPRFRVLSGHTHLGKIGGLNEAVKLATGEILLFSDMDAKLDPDALRLLVRHFADPEVGGVCGIRQIGEVTQLKGAQDSHIKFSTRIQQAESELGSVTSSEGKLYAMRRSLYEPIKPAVTDDLFTCLCVVRQGSRFLFEPGAVARIHLPSRSLPHEIVRRRRIVSTSLRGLMNNRSLFNPFRYGLYSVGLLVNKILRRLVTLFLIGALVANLLMIGPWYANLLLLAQVGFYAMLPVHLLLSKLNLRIPIVGKIASIIAYFVVGNVASMIGAIEFIIGRRVHGWDPVKSGNTSSAGQ